MPTITNPGVIATLVNAYLITGRDKVGALIKTGYSKTYANNGKGARLFERQDVLVEIKRQELALIKKTGYTKKQATQDLIDDRQLARDLNQPSAAISANSQLIRLYGMDQMDNKRDSTVIIINPPAAANAKSVESEIVNE